MEKKAKNFNRLTFNPAKKKSLATRVTVMVVIGLLVSFSVLTLIIANATSKNMISKQQDEIALIAQTNAGIAKEFMETMVNKELILVNAVKNLDKIPEEYRLSNLSAIIADAKSEAQGILSLYYVVGENAAYPTGFTLYSTAAGTASSADQTTILSKEAYDNISKGKAMAILDPYKKNIDGTEYTVISVLEPILDPLGNLQGVIGSDIDINLLVQAKYNTGNYKTFSETIVCGHQTMIMNTANPDTIGKKFVETSRSNDPNKILEVAQNPVPTNFLDTFNDGTKSYRAIVPFYVGTSKTVWLSMTTVSEREVKAPVVKQVTTQIIVCFIALLVLAFLCFFIIRKSLKPLKEIEYASQQMAKGNLKTQINHIGNDEIGSLADSIRTSMSFISNYITDIDRAMGEMAKGNFDLAPSQPFLGDFKHIEESITKFILEMSHSLSQINTAAEQVSGGSDQVSDGAQQLAQGATEQASSVQQLSASISEISEQVRENALSSERANEMAQQASTAISNSNLHMQKLMEAMNDIHAKSSEISKIIKTIEDIAFQTNILALNAAVEAARAGAAGKGFAVVADEVRNLAGKSAEAAQNTTKLIEDSVTSVNEGVKLAEITALDLQSVVKDSDATSQIISEITGATREQSKALEQITMGIDQISAVVQTNSATSEQSAAASEELSGQATILKQIVSKFKIKKVASPR